jgi:hypothetical protein
MSWHYPLLELSLASVAKDPRLLIPEHLAPLPPHIKDKLLRSMRRYKNMSPQLLAALLHKNITDLDLQDLDITDAHLDAVAQYNNFRKINLNQSKNLMRDFKLGIENSKENVQKLPSESSICKVLIGNKYLHTLFLAGWTSLTTVTMTTIVHNCPHMRYLDLGNCNRLDDQAAEVIGQLGELESLSVTGTRITDVGLASIGHSDSANTLKELRINKCVEITDEGIEMLLSGLQALEILIFNGCPKVTDDSRLALDRYLRDHRINVRQLSWTVY